MHGLYLLEGYWPLTARPLIAASAFALASVILAPITASAMSPMAGDAMLAGKTGGATTEKWVSWAQAQRALRASQHEGRAFGRMVRLQGRTVVITLVANAPKHPDMSFEIDGLTNPTLSVAQGSHVTLTFLNVAQNVGTYYYVCPIPGHADAFRMYGRFVVRATS